MYKSLPRLTPHFVFLLFYQVTAGGVTAKVEGKADVSLDSTLNSTLNASDLSLEVITEPSNDSADWTGSSENSEETGKLARLK